MVATVRPTGHRRRWPPAGAAVGSGMRSVFLALLAVAAMAADPEVAPKMSREAALDKARSSARELVIRLLAVGDIVLADAPKDPGERPSGDGATLGQIKEWEKANALASPYFGIVGRMKSARAMLAKAGDDARLYMLVQSADGLARELDAIERTEAARKKPAK